MGDPCQGERRKIVWPDEKFTHINHESISILKHPPQQDTSLRNGGHGFWVPSFCYYLLLVFEKHGLLQLESGGLVFILTFIFGGGEIAGKHYSRSFSPFPLHIEKEYLIVTWGYQVHDLSRERGHELSRMIFFLYRDEANISFNVEMYQLTLEHNDISSF